MDAVITAPPLSQCHDNASQRNEGVACPRAAPAPAAAPAATAPSSCPRVARQRCRADSNGRSRRHRLPLVRRGGGGGAWLRARQLLVLLV
eukprot:7202657-Prymnesium_polylepis.1